MGSTQWHSCACFPIWLAAASFQYYLTMELSYFKGMGVSSWRFSTSLCPWVNVHSHQCGYGQCRGGVTVRPWLPTGKVWRDGDGSFFGLWVLHDERQSSTDTIETRHQLLTSLHRVLQQNHDTVDRVTCGRKWGNIYRRAWCVPTFKLTQQPNRCGQSQSSEAWYWPSFHSEWSDIGMTVHCSSLIFGRPDIWAIEGPIFIAKGNV